ncbi:MAG TPA: carboxypeptidase-like regulatory domain-containing protein, partial [Terriglobales bacterium]|nr:carboxypeptidase-like regulatory domain-containing protein [Terriglobales bacterium]
MKYPLPRTHTLCLCLALVSWILVGFILFIACAAAQAQDASTGAIRGTVVDSGGARVPGAAVVVTSSDFGVRRELLTDQEGTFSAQLLSPGEYQVRVEAKGMAPEQLTRLQVDLGASLELWLKLRVAQASEAVTVFESPALVETKTSEISHIIDDRAIDGLPLNGRRYTDLTLLAPGVTQDPRGLTSASNGDLAYGGIRGFQSSFLVDGADNNNSFFAQARGRYRAPYQFSNEVVQEFRVSSNAYGAELGRAGGAVVNVVTKSGSNHFHGKAFYFLRDSEFGATPAFLDFKPEDRQHQFGATLGGPMVKNRVFFFAGFDQHIFHVPTIV